MRRGLSRHNNRSAGGVAFSPLSLFADGSQGVWYDDSNMATMYQDSAGTTPVTAVEQPVGKQLDLSGNNNHRTQATSANRPTLSARYNLLTKTEDLANAAWGGLNFTATAAAGIAPDGTNTATQLECTTSGSPYRIQFCSAAVTNYTAAFYVKAINQNFIAINFSDGVSFNYYASFNLNTITVISNDVQVTAPSITAVGNGWFLIKASFAHTVSAASANVGLFFVNSSGIKSSIAVGQKALVWGADFRPANQATGLIPTYQRVDTSSVYDTVGFPQYLNYNGSNSSLSTASIDFTATAQMSVFSGVRRLDNTTKLIIELSANSVTVNGTFGLFAGNINTGTDYSGYSTSSRGTASAYYNSQAAFTAPITNTLNQRIDLTQTTLFATNGLYVNATAVTPQTSTFSASTGNFSNNVLYFGTRAGTFFFNGYEYQTIIVGKTLTATEIANTETYVNSKTLAY